MNPQSECIRFRRVQDTTFSISDSLSILSCLIFFANLFSDQFMGNTKTRITIENRTKYEFYRLYDHTWAGKWENSCERIQSNHSVELLHQEKQNTSCGSVACIILRSDDLQRDIFIGWFHPCFAEKQNTTKIEVRDHDYWPAIESWHSMHNLIFKSGNKSSDQDAVIEVTASISQGSDATLQTIITHKKEKL